ncbi:MAG: RNA 2',3'-cyclic phosphodiesterase [candidate division WS2 bacterium]|uniref:RNA 2',3'-cyclic phosphodiesterase n=1 Tax=Psychracetigena formicireducens TaxID=2986056 RepID=A0A9E2BER0_PSYF1|nr:RNA 2',3'-cyclic phosphodiesterase [Candidatus Psychracetigena formicireducens]MBT9144258.1 RNA 2',3'-cyclic phosphodiesterase [Candidatus Psychracetigena formicireducens]MBT9150480.1 RNA 2',3'-cyclic phosphodiesterase [Candidatus Psychracetigena formicireducens]
MRIFSGIPITGQCYGKLNSVLQELSVNNTEYRWVLPQNTHITLHFFGERKIEEVELIHRIMQKKISQFTSIIIRITNAGAFPDNRKPRVIFFNLEDKGYLKNIYQDISGALREQKVDFDDKSFVSHLTLGRLARKYTNSKMPSIEPLNELLEIKQVNLYQTVLNPAGAVYTVLREYPLTNL